METQISSLNTKETNLNEDYIRVRETHKVLTFEGVLGTYHAEGHGHKYIKKLDTRDKTPVHQQNHKTLRLAMRWGFCGTFCSIADLTDNEIQRIKSLIQTEGNFKERGGYSNKEWYNALNTEILVRKKKADILAKKFIQLSSINKRNGLYDLLSKNKDVFISETL